MLRRWGVLQNNLALSIGLIMWIGHRKEILNLTFRAFRPSSERIDTSTRPSLSDCRSVCLSVCLSVFLLICLSVSLFLCPSISLYLQHFLTREQKSITSNFSFSLFNFIFASLFPVRSPNWFCQQANMQCVLQRFITLYCRLNKHSWTSQRSRLASEQKSFFQ